MSYYEIIKNSRLKKDDLKNIPLSSPYRYSYSGVTETLDTEYKLLQVIKTSMLVESYGNPHTDEKLFYHKINDNLLISEYTTWGRTPGSILDIYTSNILSFAIIERLKDYYNVSNLSELMLVVDKTKSLNHVIDIIKELYYSNGGVFYGFFCPSIRWCDPKRINRTIKTRKFTIVLEHLLNHLVRPIRVLPSGEVFIGETDTKPFLYLKAKDRCVGLTSLNSSWVFSLTEEHLEERIETITNIYKEQLITEIQEGTDRIKRIQRNLDHYNEETEKKLYIIENFEEEYKNKIWKWRDF